MNTPFFIAEAWVNHNWDIDKAFKLIDAAKEAWASAVKFQTFKAEQVVTWAWKMAEYQKENLWIEESQIEMLRKLELTEENFIELEQYCDKVGIEFMSTPHGSFQSVDFLAPLVKRFKFWSWDLTNLPVLEHAAKYGKEIILWTWMWTIEEIHEAVETIKNTWNKEIVLLHCTTNYPTPQEEVNLNAMTTMINEFPNCKVWYSDHTLWWITPALATALWATCIEKHYTLDKWMEWPDHAASANPEELKQIINHINNTVKEWLEVDDIKSLIEQNNIHKEDAKDVDIILWSSEKKPNPSEIAVMKIVRRSIVAAGDIKAWETITKEHLELKRPLTDNALHPREYNNLLWKIAQTDISPDSVITDGMIS